MSKSYTQFQIQMLRAHNVQKVQEAVMVTLFSLFSLMILPQLIITYFLGEAAYMQPPAYLQQIPYYAYGFSALYMPYVVVGNLRRAAQIKSLMQELEVQEAFSDDTSPAVAAAELEELEKMVDEALADSSASERTAAKSAKRAREAKKA